MPQIQTPKGTLVVRIFYTQKNLLAMPIGCEKAGYYKTLIFHIEKISQNHMKSGKHKGIANKKSSIYPY